VAEDRCGGGVCGDFDDVGGGGDGEVAGVMVPSVYLGVAGPDDEGAVRVMHVVLKTLRYTYEVSTCLRYISHIQVTHS
jgi:hypothetical protein